MLYIWRRMEHPGADGAGICGKGAGTHKRRTGGTGSGGEVDSRDYDLQHRSVIRMPDVRMDRRCGGHAWDHMPGGADPVRSCIRI